MLINVICFEIFFQQRYNNRIYFLKGSIALTNFVLHKTLLINLLSWIYQALSQHVNVKIFSKRMPLYTLKHVHSLKSGQ